MLLACLASKSIIHQVLTDPTIMDMLTVLRPTILSTTILKLPHNLTQALSLS